MGPGSGGRKGGSPSDQEMTASARLIRTSSTGRSPESVSTIPIRFTTSIPVRTRPAGETHVSGIQLRSGLEPPDARCRLSRLTSVRIGDAVVAQSTTRPACIESWGVCTSTFKLEDITMGSIPLWKSDNTRHKTDEISNWTKKGILYFNDLRTPSGELMSFAEANQVYNLPRIFLDYAGLLNSSPRAYVEKTKELKHQL